MDFGSTIKQAVKQSSQGAKKEVKYYSTKFEPPKKLERNKTLSANIQKFLAKQKEEEKQKALEAQRKKDRLLALRAQDKKASRRVNVMLKRTKSANQSVMEDAVDIDNTSVANNGLSQPDEDDYGYVSQSASEYYNKLMEKYNSMPEEPKFSFEKKKPSPKVISNCEKNTSDLKRKRKSNSYEEPYVPEAKEKEPSKPKLKPAPVINFNDLLKIAEKKQFEPVVIEAKKEKEEERLLTKKEKLEREKERELREQKERREKERLMASKMPKTNGESANIGKSKLNKAPSTAVLADNKKEKRLEEAKSRANSTKCDTSNKSNAARDLQHHKMRDTIQETRALSSGKSSNVLKSREVPLNKDNRSKVLNSKEKCKDFPPKDMMRPKQFPPKDLKPKQFPPQDVRGPVRRKRPLPINKGRFYDDDEDYDSEMDDFIDDGPEEDQDYSKYISEIFGYDKKKYRYVDEEDDNMETSFAQQMREEMISTKIGIMEDLEEARKEEEHNRRKALMKKKYKL